MQLIQGRSLAEIIAEMRTQAAPQEKNDRRRDHLEMVNAEFRSKDTDTSPVAVATTWNSNALRQFIPAAVQLGIQIGQALHFAHQQGVVHRDVKPANILVDCDGMAWITDFGLARLESDVGMTMTGDLIGTLRYMAPEQAAAKLAVIDERVDIYSLGITLYELLTLHPAFASQDRQQLLRQIADEDPLAPRRLVPHLPFDLETIILKAIEKAPEDRYSSAEELVADLQALLE